MNPYVVMTQTVVRSLLFILCFACLTMPGAAIEDGFQRNNAAFEQRRGKSRHPLVVRLHLVRHGETEANREDLVLGQRESPLTDKGINQARALGRFIFNRDFSPSSFWRAYSSDYERTQITANTILGANDASDRSDTKRETELSVVVDGEIGKIPSSPSTGGSGKVGDSGATAVLDAVTTATTISGSTFVRPDKRLRERAKGVREGRPKSLTYQEALALYHAEKQGSTGINGGTDLPLLESDDDVWNRVKSWIDEIVRDACREDGDVNNIDGSDVIEPESKRQKSERSKIETECDTDSALIAKREDLNGETANHFHSPATVNVRNVLAVSHSATIRTTLNRLVGNQLPSDISTKPVGDDGQIKGMLVIPNTSRTIVDIVVEEAKAASFGTGSSDETKSGKDTGEIGEATAGETITTETPSWSAKLVDLANTDHFSMLPP
mmetsp:Transcript_18152/g.26616  ORF Transcript_18152/g.26616 Transcript_18152/m.26616 type:complete len:439 (-) Transcript_18152:199-1515(-)